MEIVAADDDEEGKKPKIDPIKKELIRSGMGLALEGSTSSTRGAEGVRVVLYMC